MTVALFHPWIYTRGGAERLILEWLKRTEHDVNVYTWVYRPEDTFREFEKFNVEQVLPDWLFDKAQYLMRGIALGLTGMWKRFLNGEDVLLISTAGIAELVLYSNRARWNIAYVHTPLRAAHPDDLPWIRREKYPITWNPWSWVRRLYFEVSTAGYNMLEKPAWKRLDAAMFNSRVTLERARKKGLLNGQPTRVIWPGVDIPERIEDRSTGTGRILYLSRISDAKRQLELVKAWKRIQKDLPREATLVIAGAKSKPSYAQRVAEEARGHRIEIKTDLTYEQVQEEYMRADACVFLGRNEDFGIAPLEALAWGKPLITVDKGGFWDVIDKIRAPGVLPIRDGPNLVEELAKGLIYFFEHLEEWKALGRRNAEAIRSIDLSWDRMAREIDEFINQIAR